MGLGLVLAITGLKIVITFQNYILLQILLIDGNNTTFMSTIEIISVYYYFNSFKITEIKRYKNFLKCYGSFSYIKKDNTSDKKL